MHKEAYPFVTLSQKQRCETQQFKGSTMTTISKTAAFISRAIEFSGKSQREIAKEVGFPKPNIISMLKKGEMKLPLDRIPDLAKACHVDPTFVFRLAMEEYHPAIWEVLVNTIGMPLGFVSYGWCDIG